MGFKFPEKVFYEQAKEQSKKSKLPFLNFLDNSKTHIKMTPEDD